MELDLPCLESDDYLNVGSGCNDFLNFISSPARIPIRLVKNLSANSERAVWLAASDPHLSPIQKKRQQLILKFSDGRYGDEAVQHLQDEFNIYQTLVDIQNYYIPRCYGKAWFHGNLCIVLGFEEGMNLHHDNLDTLSPSEKIVVSNEIHKTGAAISKYGVIHADIKSDNLIFNRASNTVKAIDFGESTPEMRNADRWDLWGQDKARMAFDRNSCDIEFFLHQYGLVEKVRSPERLWVLFGWDQKKRES